MSSQSPEGWFWSLPPITRFITTATFLTTLGFTFGILGIRFLLLDGTKILSPRIQLWRLFTDYLFAGTFSLGWIMHMYFFVTFSGKLEGNAVFRSSPGGYLYFLFLQMLALDIISIAIYWPTGRAVMAPALVMAIIYYWSRKEPYGQLSLWGFQVQAYQFPFALIFVDLLMGNSLLIDIMGLATGHLYYFLRDVLPMEKDLRLLEKTPRFFDEFMKRSERFDPQDIVTSMRIMAFGLSAAPPPPASRFTASYEPPTRLFTGQGRRLAD